MASLLPTRGYPHPSTTPSLSGARTPWVTPSHKCPQPPTRGPAFARGSAPAALPSFHVVADLAEAVAAATPAGPVPVGTKFEAQIDAQALYAQLSVLGLSVACGAYWWFVVVPSARGTLAKEKRIGAVKTYLEDIEGDESRGLERWFYTDWLDAKAERDERVAAAKARRAGVESTSSAVSSADMAAGGSTSPADADPASGPEPVPSSTTATTAVVERAPEKGSSETPEKQPTVGDLFTVDDSTPMPSFWSLDNPLVATGALIAAGVGVAALVGGPHP